MVMMFKFEFNEIKILILMLFGLPLITATNIDCNGKAFHCVNSTHFMICVDLGSGVSKTLDDFVIPCPPTTACRLSNKYECEYLPVTTTVLPVSPSEVNNEVTENPSTLAWEPITVTTNEQRTNEVEQSEKYNALNNSTLTSELVLSTNAEPTEVATSLLSQDTIDADIDAPNSAVTESNVEIISTVASSVMANEETSQSMPKSDVTELFGFTNIIVGGTTATSITLKSNNGLSSTKGSDISVTPSSLLSTETSFTLNETDNKTSTYSEAETAVTNENIIEIDEATDTFAGVPSTFTNTIVGDTTAPSISEITSESNNGLSSTKDSDISVTPSSLLSTETSFTLNETDNKTSTYSEAETAVTNENIIEIDEATDTIAGVPSTFTNTIVGDTTAPSISEITSESNNGLSSTKGSDISVTPSSLLSTETSFTLNETDNKTSTYSEAETAVTNENIIEIDEATDTFTGVPSTFTNTIVGDTTAPSISEITSESNNGLSSTKGSDISVTPSSLLSTETSFNLNEADNKTSTYSEAGTAITNENIIEIDEATDTFAGVPSTTPMVIPIIGAEETTPYSIVNNETSSTLTPVTQILSNIQLDTGLPTQITEVEEATFFVTEKYSTLEKQPPTENNIVMENVTVEMNNDTAFIVLSNTSTTEVTPQAEETTSAVIGNEINDDTSFNTIPTATTPQTLTTMSVDTGVPASSYVAEETTILPVATNTTTTDAVSKALPVSDLVTEKKSEPTSNIFLNGKPTEYATTISILEPEVYLSSSASNLETIAGDRDSFTTNITPGLEVQESSIVTEGNGLSYTLPDTTVTESYNAIIISENEGSSLGVLETKEESSSSFATTKGHDTSLPVLSDTKMTSDNVTIAESDLLTIYNRTNSITESKASTSSKPEEKNPVIIDAVYNSTESPYVTDTKIDSSFMNPGITLPSYILKETIGNETTEKTSETVSSTISGTKDIITDSSFIADSDNETINNINHNLTSETLAPTSTLSIEQISGDAMIIGNETTEKTSETVSSVTSGIEDIIIDSSLIADSNNDTINNYLKPETVTATSTPNTEEISSDAKNTLLSNSTEAVSNVSIEPRKSTLSPGKEDINDTTISKKTTDISKIKLELGELTSDLEQKGQETSFDGISNDHTTEIVINGYTLQPKLPITTTDVGDGSNFNGLSNDKTIYTTIASILESTEPKIEEKTSDRGFTFNSVTPETIASVIISTEIPSSVVHAEKEKNNYDEIDVVTDDSTNAASAGLSTTLRITTADPFLTIDLSPPVDSYTITNFVGSKSMLNGEALNYPISNDMKVNLTPKSTTQTYFASVDANTENIFKDDSISRDIITDKNYPTTKIYTEQESINTVENIINAITSIDQIPVTESNLYTEADEKLQTSRANQLTLNTIHNKQTSVQETNSNIGLKTEVETKNSGIPSQGSDLLMADTDSVLTTDPKISITHLNDVASTLVTELVASQINNKFISDQFTNGETKLSNIDDSTQDNIIKSISNASESAKIAHIETNSTNNPLKDLILNTSNAAQSSNQNIRNTGFTLSDLRFSAGNSMSKTNKTATTTNIPTSSSDFNGGLKTVENIKEDDSSTNLQQLTKPKNNIREENQETLFTAVNMPKSILETNTNVVLKSNNVENATVKNYAGDNQETEQNIYGTQATIKSLDLSNDILQKTEATKLSLPTSLTDIIDKQLVHATVSSKELEVAVNKISLSETTTVIPQAESRFTTIEKNTKFYLANDKIVDSINTNPTPIIATATSQSIDDLTNIQTKTVKSVVPSENPNSFITTLGYEEKTDNNNVENRKQEQVAQHLSKNPTTYSPTDSTPLISGRDKSVSTTPIDSKPSDLDRTSLSDSTNNKIIPTQVNHVKAESATEAVLTSSTFATTFSTIAPLVNQKNIEPTKASSVTTATTNASKPPFNCIGRRRGRYSDPDVCRKYYVCIGLVQPIIGICPGNTVFSNLNKQCTKNLSHCIRGNEFQCFSEGRFFDIYKNNIYYICVKNDVGKFYRFKLQCQIGFSLNKNSMKCIKNKPLNNSESVDSTSKSESDKSSNNKSKEEKENKNFECEEEGKFVYPGNCRKYYVCKKKKSSFRRKTKKCDSDELFHQEKRKCVDADSYEC